MIISKQISVLNLNDNMPVFSRDTYYFNIPENTLIGQIVGTITAADKDQTYVLKYMIAKNDHLEINEFSGEILIMTPLDYEDRFHAILEMRSYTNLVKF